MLISLTNPSLREELLAMAGKDQAVRAELAVDGSLFEGYHPRMEEVHRRNAKRLRAILEEIGWPGPRLVGEDGAAAAWLIVQHAIGDPSLMRLGLTLLKQAAPGDVPRWQLAMLEDRICAFEGRPQIYGTQYDWDHNGAINPLPIADPDRVNERRHSVGLGALEENTRRMRECTFQGSERAPTNWAERRRKKEEWERSVGWRS
jgi:hypothetical protein